MTLDERIGRLEVVTCRPGLQGTIITRVLPDSEHNTWILSLGEVGMPKDFFKGKSIADTIHKAELHYKIEEV